jgi:hypothetical protein
MGIRTRLELSLALAGRLSKHGACGENIMESIVHPRLVDQCCQCGYFLVGPEQKCTTTGCDEHFYVFQCVV